MSYMSSLTSLKHQTLTKCQSKNFLMGKIQNSKDNSKKEVRVLFLRDFKLEKKVERQVELTTGKEILLKRYQISEAALPKHYALNLICHFGSSELKDMNYQLTNGTQANLASGHSSSMEFIDVWENICVESILPQIKKVFDEDSQLHFKKSLFAKLDSTIYLSSIFRKIGNDAVTWWERPNSNPECKINCFETKVLEEIAGESLLVTNLKEYPEVAELVILKRLFWHGRQGFKMNPHSGRANEQSESWIALYLWNELKRHQVLEVKNKKLRFNNENVQKCFTEILKQIKSLFELRQAENSEASKTIQNWMRQNVKNSKNKFYYPNGYKKTLQLCKEIVESPVFIPTFVSATYMER